MANETQQVAKAQKTPLQKFNDSIRGANAQSYLASVLGEKKDTFVTSLVSVVAGNAMLQKCDPMSVIYAAMKSVPLGLPIESNLGYAAVIPYGDDAQFQIMRNGWVELAMRTGQVRHIANEVVHEGELVKRNRFTDTYEFDESLRKSDKIIGVMAYIQLTNGFEKTVYMTKEEINAHALRYSQTYKKGYGVWKDNWEAMALKTVLKRLIVKYCPKSTEVLSAIKNDQSVSNPLNESTYADNPIDDQGAQAEPQASEQAKAKAEEVAAAIAKTKERRAAAEAKAVPETPVGEGKDPELEDLFTGEK